MKRIKKIIIGIVFLIIIIIAGIYGYFIRNKSIIEEKHSYKYYEFEVTDMYEEENLTCIDMKITNLDVDFEIEDYHIFINFYNKNNEIIYIYEYIVPEIKLGDTKKETIRINVLKDDIYDYKVDEVIP